MKKLMIVAAIVCAAAMAQASQIKWTAGLIKTFDGKANYAGTAILTVYDAGGNAIATAEGVFKDGYVYDKTITDQKWVLVGQEGANKGPIISGSIYSCEYTITDAAGNVFASGIKSNLQAKDSQPVGAAFMAKGSWTAAPTPAPEPTSGLLLLLGVAGMALRRRRA